MNENTFRPLGKSLAQVTNDQDFVLLICNEFCIFVTRYHFQVMINFFYAREHAKTWRDFRCICGPIASEFCTAFMQCDEYKPMDEDLLEDITDDIWILFDGEFPGVQCAEETTTRYGNAFPNQYRIESITTEYGEKIDLYSAEKIEEILEASKLLGIRLEIVRSPFPITLNNYG
jgi:hypothetical protein